MPFLFMLHFIMFVSFLQKIYKNPHPVFIYDFKIKCTYMLAFIFFIFINCENKKPPNTKKRQAL